MSTLHIYLRLNIITSFKEISIRILKLSNFLPPLTKQINDDPSTEMKSSSIPHTGIKLTSTTQTKTKSISMITLKPRDLRPASENRVHLDHHHLTKSKSFDHNTQNMLKLARTRSNSIPRPKNKSILIPTLKPSQIRSLTKIRVLSTSLLKSSRFDPHSEIK